MNDELQTTTETVTDNLQNFYNRIVNFLPQLLAGIIIILIGWIIAVGLGRLVTKLLKMARVDQAAERLGVNTLGERVGRKISVAEAFGWLVKWFFLIITFIIAADAMNLEQVTQFLNNQVIPYFGDVVIAAIILTIGIMAANFTYSLIQNALKAGRFTAPVVVASVARWSIIILTVIAALAQLRVADFFMRFLFVAIVFMIALAGGLAFGLGGREHAKNLLDSISKQNK